MAPYLFTRHHDPRAATFEDLGLIDGTPVHFGQRKAHNSEAAQQQRVWLAAASTCPDKARRAPRKLVKDPSGSARPSSSVEIADEGSGSHPPEMKTNRKGSMRRHVGKFVDAWKGR